MDFSSGSPTTDDASPRSDVDLSVGPSSPPHALGPGSPVGGLAKPEVVEFATVRPLEPEGASDWMIAAEKYSSVPPHENLGRIVRTESGFVTARSAGLRCTLSRRLSSQAQLDKGLAERMRHALVQIASAVAHLHDHGVAHGEVNADNIVTNDCCTHFALLPPANFSSCSQEDDVRDLGFLLAQMLAVARRSKVHELSQSFWEQRDPELCTKLNAQLVAERHGMPLLHLMACGTSTPLGYSLQPGVKSVKEFVRTIPTGDLVTERHKTAILELMPLRLLCKAVATNCFEAIAYACAPHPAGPGLTIHTVLDERSGMTAIHYAAHCGAVGSIAMLVGMGADVNARTGATLFPPLAFAAMRDNVDVIRLLVSLGADIHALCGKQSKPIHYAARSGAVGAVKELMSLGCSVDELDFCSCTPLYHACQGANSSLRVLQLLVREGADVNRACDGFYPLYVAARCMDVDAVRFLLSVGADGSRAVLLASRRKRLEAVEFLVKNGVDADAALFLCAQKGCGAVIKLLVAAGAGVNSRRNGATALLLAARHNNVDAIRELLALGADVNAATPTGYTVFRAAVKYRSLQAISKLASAGAKDVNAVNKIGNTAIHIAHRKGDTELVAALAAAVAEAARQR